MGGLAQQMAEQLANAQGPAQPAQPPADTGPATNGNGPQFE
jgi:hypothetical protein